LLIVLKRTNQVCMLSFKPLIARLMIAVALGCASVVAQAQLSSLPEFFENHFHTEATDAQDGPKLHTHFDYNAYDMLITSNQVNMNNDGFEDYMTVGMLQKFGNTNAKVTYNLHRFDYSSGETQASDVTFDFNYRTLRVQHRLEDTAEVSTISRPFDLSGAHLDLSFNKTHRNDSADTIDEYRFVSRFNQLKFSATWMKSPVDTGIDFNAEYRPLGCWLMTYSYTAHGDDLQRQFRSEYTAMGFRLTGEYISDAVPGGEQTRIASAIGIEKDTRLAVLKLRLEHNEFIEVPTIVFKLESRVAF
jgi:hypothetical protein